MGPIKTEYPRGIHESTRWGVEVYHQGTVFDLEQAPVERYF